MKKILIGGAIIVVIVVVALVLVVGNINAIVKKGVETVGPMVLKVPVTLDKADISVFSGSGRLTGLTIGNPPGFHTEYAFQLGNVQMDIDTGSVTTDRIHVKSIVIDAPSITFEGAFDKSNLSQLQANAAAYTASGKNTGASPAGQQSSEPPGEKIQIDHLTIKNGDINVSMNLLQGKKLTAALPPIELTDIGKDGGVSIADAMKKVLVAVNKAVIPAIQTNLTKLNLDQGVQNAVEAVQEKTGGALQEQAEKGLGKVKGLFGK
jgi:hypothetical protein